jgi:hypothetical protein
VRTDPSDRMGIDLRADYLPVSGDVELPLVRSSREPAICHWVIPACSRMRSSTLLGNPRRTLSGWPTIRPWTT